MQKLQKVIWLPCLYNLILINTIISKILSPALDVAIGLSNSSSTSHPSAPFIPSFIQFLDPLKHWKLILANCLGQRAKLTLGQGRG
jgi:hypothetical protein